MKKSRAKASFIFARRKFRKSLKNVRWANNHVSFEKEEILLSKLEDKLGRPKEEVRGMISDGLMDLLTMVPFSVKK